MSQDENNLKPGLYAVLHENEWLLAELEHKEGCEPFFVVLYSHYQCGETFDPKEVDKLVFVSDTPYPGDEDR